MLAPLSVRILEKEYIVACAPDERTELLDSAEFLNGGCGKSATAARSSGWIASP